MEGHSESAILTDPVNTAACPKCGAMLEVAGLEPFTTVQCPACSFEFQVPARFGNFMLLQLLGAGGMGGVYRARDEGLNREVAIKVMLKSLGDDPQFVETFQREAQAAARLNHPNIAQIYSFGQEKGQPYIAMELVSGGSLDKMMAAQGPLDPTAVVHIGAQVAEGLREAAEAGLVHGDVKPENILFDNEKNAKLVDFGLSAMASGPGNDVWGTPYYIAPEKVRRQKSDFRSDIYSLGGTLYHAIAGVPPFEGEDATAVVKARFDGPPRPMSEVRGKVPAEVERLIARMLEVEPQTRYPTYGSLLSDMRGYLSKAGPVQLGASSKKIMIKNKRAGATTGQMSMTGQMSSTGQVQATGVLAEVPAGMVPVDQIEEEGEGERAKPNYKKMLLIAGGVAVLVALAVGGIHFAKKRGEAKKAAAELAQLQGAQGKSKVRIAKAVETAKRQAESVRASATEALSCAKAAADAVVAVLGEDVRGSLVPPEPAEEQPAAPAAGTNAAPAQAAAPAPEPAPAAAGGESAYPSLASTRSMYESAYAVNAAARLAERVQTEVEAQAKSAEGLLKVESAQVAALTKLAGAMEEKISAPAYVKAVADAPRKVLQLKKSLASVKSEVVSLADLKKREALDKEKKQKEGEAAEKKQQEQEAYKEKAKTEVEKVGGVEAANASALKQLQFREVLRTLKELGDELTTQEAQDALAVAVERVNRIKDFHTYLVEKVPGYKAARGWSVDSADQKTLTVGGKKIPWVDVYGGRLEIVGELVKGLVMDEKATKELRLREKTRLMTNAALCLSAFYREVPSAQELAKTLATQSAQQFDVDADTIKQLLPEFFK